MSSMVPVVGGILADAAETVLAGAGILRRTVGIFGMLSILAMCIPPFLQLGIHFLVYKATAVLASTLSGGRVTGLIDGFGGAFGLVLGMTGACALILLIALISSVSLAGG
jgi:stage III sporulation protein AE